MSATQPLQQVNSKSEKEKLTLQKFVNTPWILGAGLIAGIVLYLLWHPDLIQIGINNPWTSATIGALVAAIFVIRLIHTFFSGITKWINLQIENIKKENSENRYFGFVIFMFILASVLESGPFFASVQRNDLYGVLGYLIILVFDLSAVRFMQARKKALAHGDEKLARTYTLGVWLTALVSGFANASSSLIAYVPPTKGHLPSFMSDVAPWTGVIFPVMIVFLSYTIDADVDGKNAVQRYKEKQQQKFDLLTEKRVWLAKILQENAQIALLEQRAFALKNLLFTKNKFLAVVEQVTIKIHEQIDAELATSKTDLKEAHKEVIERITSVEELVQTAENNKQLILAAQTQITSDRQIIESQLESLQQQDHSVLITEIVHRDFPILLGTALNNYLPDIVDKLRNEMQNQLRELSQNQLEFIDAKFRDIEQTTVVQVTETLQKDMQFQLTTKFEQARLEAPKITEISVDQSVEDEDIEIGQRERIVEPHNEKIETRTPKGFGYAMTDKSFELDGVTYARTDVIVGAFKIDDLTEEMLKKIALHGLVDPIHFKYVKTSGWGNKYYKLMTEVTPNVKRLVAQAVIDYGETL